MELTKEMVKLYIPKGKANAITGEALSSYLRQSNTRKIRLLIQDLIADGVPVCSSPHRPYGYYIAETREEVNEALKILKYGYGSEIFRHYRNLVHARNRMFPQLGLKI